MNLTQLKCVLLFLTLLSSCNVFLLPLLCVCWVWQ